MKFDLLMNQARSIVLVDCELVRLTRQINFGWMAMAPGNYRPVEWVQSEKGLKIGIQIRFNIRHHASPSVFFDPKELLFLDLDSDFAREFFRT